MSTFADILHQRCPRCRMGHMFRSSIFLGYARMYERCPVCGLQFEREPGYFLGAMYVSYLLALIIILMFGAVLLLTTHLRLDKVAIWAVVGFLPFAPMLSLLARVLWIYLDQSIDPDRTL
jgi:uncharacterized protein (DUF983 family)